MSRQFTESFVNCNRVQGLSLACLLGLAACGGGGGGNGGGGGPPPPPPAGADLSAGLAAAASVTPGATLTYTASLVVTGNAVSAVTATLTLPVGVTVGAISDGGTLAGNQVSWPAIATLAVGTATRTVEVTAPSIGPLNATLQVATTSTESSAGNNSASRRTVIGFDALATLAGEAAGDGFGFVADAIGDIDADGALDFIVGAPANDGGGNDAGRAYVYSGASAALLFTVSGQAAGENLGWSAAAAGDVDGDGVGDFLVGGPGSGAGVVRVYSGATGVQLYALTGPAAGSRFGSVVTGIGDVDGDGRADLAIGAEETSGGRGQISIVSGATGASIRDHVGPAPGAKYGYGVGALGDVNGDGVPDYGGGAFNGGGGVVAVRSGADGSLLYSVSPVATAGQLGFIWIDSVGDVDGDARPDFFAADINDSGNRGRGYLVSGADGTVIRTIAGTASGEFFGIARHGGHDADGDGIPDLFIAGYHNGEGAALGGKAYVHSGADGALLRTMTSSVANETLGYDAVQLGDVNGDGLVDYLLSGDIEQGTSGRGRVYVIRGTPLP